MRWGAATFGMLCFATLSSSALAQSYEHQDRCFVITQYKNWRPGDADTIYLRVLPDRIFRLGLTRACLAIKWPNAYLILKPRGGERFCSANDFDLKISMGKQTFDEPCIVKTMTLLSPAEAEALPPGQRP